MPIMWNGAGIWINIFKCGISEIRYFIEIYSIALASIDVDKIEESLRPLHEEAGDFEDAGDYGGRGYNITHGQYILETKQGIINSGAIHLAHLFENQISFFVSNEIDRVNKLHDKLFEKKAFSYEKINCEVYSKFEGFFDKVCGIAFFDSKYWAEIKNLKTISDTFKHGKGKSYKKLVEDKSPHLLNEVALESFTTHDSYNEPLFFRPLAGEGAYFNEENLRHYADAMISFWGWLIQELERRSEESNKSES